MAKKQDSFLRRLARGFKNKKPDPEAVIAALRKEGNQLEETLHGLEFDLKKLRKERERVIQKGTQAHKKGDSILVQESAHDLKAINAELSLVQQNRSNIIKSRMLCRMSQRKLTSTLPGGAMEAAKRVLDLIQDEELTLMLQDRECSEEQFQEILDRKVDTFMRGIEDRVNHTETETSAEVNLFAELAAAEESGDQEKVRAVMEKMTDESDKDGADFESLLS